MTKGFCLPSMALLFALAVSSSLPAQGSSCTTPQGLSLTVTGGRLGDVWTLQLSGQAGAPGLLALDTGGGPVTTPIGPICLDLSPALSLLPVTLDSFGALSLTGILPASPALSGLSFFLQAAVQDFSQPSGLALSNGASLTGRPPRLFLLDRGLPNLGFGGGTPAALLSYDALSDTVGFNVTLATDALDFLRVPSLGWIMVLLSDGTLVGLDDTTGANVLNVSLASTFPFPTKIALSPDQTTLLALCSGASNPFSTTPGTVLTVALPSGLVTATINLNSASPTSMTPFPGTNIVYLSAGSSIIPLDYVTATELPAIPMGTGFGSVADQVIVGNQLVVLLGGLLLTPTMTLQPAVNAVDTNTQTAVLPNASPLPANGMATALRFGPGPQGPTLLALQPFAGNLFPISPGTLVPSSPVLVPTGISEIGVSTGGLSWLLVLSGGAGNPFGSPTPGTLFALDAATFTMTTVGSLPAADQQSLVPLPSSSLRKAYLASGLSSLIVIPTDPVSQPAPPINLPPSARVRQIISE